MKQNKAECHRIKPKKIENNKKDNKREQRKPHVNKRIPRAHLSTTIHNLKQTCTNEYNKQQQIDIKRDELKHMATNGHKISQLNITKNQITHDNNINQQTTTKHNSNQMTTNETKEHERK